MVKEPEEIATKAWDAAVLRRLQRYARPHKRAFLLSFLVLVVLFALQLTAPWLLAEAIDGPIQAAQDARLVAGDVEFDAQPFLRELGFWASAYLVCVALAAVCRYLEVSQLARTGQAVIHDLRTQVFAHMHGLDLAWFDRTPTGSLVTRVTSDIENLNELFTSGLIVLLFDLVKIVVLIALLFTISAPLAIVVLVLTPVLIGVSLVFRGGARRAHRRVRARLAAKNGYLQEVLSGIRIVQVFRREDRVSGRFGEHLSGYLQANFRAIFLFAVFYPVVGFVTVLIQGSILWRGGQEIAVEVLSVGDFIRFWFWLQLLIGPVRELGERYNVLQSAFASAERIFDILDTKTTVPPASRPTALPTPFRADVRFENVSFAYETGPKVLDDVSFEIPAGQTVAIVGATGAGKSTLVNLLLRYYDATEGRVTIDGIDVRELDEDAFRRHVGLVLQEDFLFSGTVRDNLELGRSAVTDETLARALETSSAGDVVARLSDGLDSEVAERGASLSTGERELIAIARALAANPSLVIFDEATASVDSATEARIEAATYELLEGRSALVVAHRLSTVRRADQILVMHHGQLRERGTHEELLREGGIYARLYEMQFKEAGEARAG